MEVHGCPWKSMEVHGSTWTSMDVHICPWKCIHYLSNDAIEDSINVESPDDSEDAVGFFVVDEMELRLAGNWQENDDDNELQNRFWSNFKSSKHHGIVRSRIGAKFLRDNRESEVSVSRLVPFFS